jgi:hypothetical protein
MSKVNIAVGTKLYEPDQRRSGYREYDVVSIGRKWIQLKPEGRCNFSLMRDGGGYAPRQLYLSIEAYESERRLSAAWSDLCRDIQRAKRPEGITVDEINAIRVKLGLKVLGQPEADQ